MHIEVDAWKAVLSTRLKQQGVIWHLVNNRVVSMESLVDGRSGQSHGRHQTQIEGWTGSLGQSEAENNPLVVVARNAFREGARKTTTTLLLVTLFVSLNFPYVADKLRV